MDTKIRELVQIYPQFPLGWLLIQIQTLPFQWWLKYPQRLHSPHLAMAQFHLPQAKTSELLYPFISSR